MPAARTHNARATALALATGVNGLLLALLMSSHGRAPAPQQTITAMIWIAPPEPPPPRQPPATRTAPRSGVPVANSAGLAPPPPMAAAPLQQSPQDTTIDLPRIDWGEAAVKAVREQLRKEEELATRSRSLNSMPEVMVLPRDGGYEKGHVERLEGGVTMTFDGDCVTTSDPQVMQPWHWIRWEGSSAGQHRHAGFRRVAAAGRIKTAAGVPRRSKRP